MARSLAAAICLLGCAAASAHPGHAGGPCLDENGPAAAGDPYQCGWSGDRGDPGHRHPSESREAALRAGAGWPWEGIRPSNPSFRGAYCAEADDPAYCAPPAPSAPLPKTSAGFPAAGAPAEAPDGGRLQEALERLAALDGIEAGIEALRARDLALGEALERLAAQGGEAARERRALEMDFADGAALRLDFESGIEAAAAERGALRAGIEAAAAERGTLSAGIEAAAAERGALRAGIKAAAVERGTLRAGMGALADAGAARTLRLDAHEARIAANSGALAAMAPRVLANERAAAALRADVDGLRSGVAAAMAMGAIPAAERGIGAGAARYAGRAAVAVGFRRRHGPLSVSAAAGRSGPETALAVGVGWSF